MIEGRIFWTRKECIWRPILFFVGLCSGIQFLVFIDFWRQCPLPVALAAPVILGAIGFVALVSPPDGFEYRHVCNLCGEPEDDWHSDP